MDRAEDYLSTSTLSQNGYLTSKTHSYDPVVDIIGQKT